MGRFESQGKELLRAAGNAVPRSRLAMCWSMALEPHLAS
jgi:hypothetical protein